jgi:hypothetical protein
VRVAEKRDVILGSTSFLKPNAYIDALANLLEASPLPPPPMSTAYVSWIAASRSPIDSVSHPLHATRSSRAAEVVPLSGGEIHIEIEKPQAQAQGVKPASESQASA